MSETVIVVSLRPEVSAPVERACALLNSAQGQFSFQTRSAVRTLPPPDMDNIYSWDLLEDLLAEEKRHQEAAYLFCVMDDRIENNWFSHRVFKEQACCITTHDWGYLSPLPRSAFIAFAIVRNIVQLLYGSHLFHDEMRGCVNDLCADKPNISFGMRTADVCAECRDRLLRLPSETLDVVIAMLEEVRQEALGRRKVSEPAASSLAERVKREYPFPISNCFHYMQSELSYSRKWSKLLELTEVSLKYTTMVLLAALATDREASEVNPEIRMNLRRPSLGHWNGACFQAIRATEREADAGFLARFLNSTNRKTIQAAEMAVSRLNHQRNDTAHGSLREEMRYQHLYETHLADIEEWLNFISPLASYELIVPASQLQRRRGVTSFQAKVLMGSHQIFSIKGYETNEQIDTECLLHDPATGRFLSLFPWLLMAPCPKCERETVFFYNQCDEKNVVMQDYPDDHPLKYQGEHYDEIQKWLAPRRTS